MHVRQVDWMLWPCVQSINFKFVPAPYRVMYVNGITMLYDVWLSYAKHNQLNGSPMHGTAFGPK